MAVVKLLPRKAAPAQGRQQSMEERLGYDANPDKTREGRLVSSYMCQPETAAAEFEASKILYEAATGRSQPKNRDVTMYRVMQSFKPGEITPEAANRIGYELAMEFTQGQHQFVVYTHEDKAHIHNHIEINSTNLECDGKFKNVKDSVDVLRRINDRICLSHGLSIPEPKRERALTEGEKGAARNGKSFKERLRHTIDSQLPGCSDFEEFLSRMRAEGYEVKHRGSLWNSVPPARRGSHVPSVWGRNIRSSCCGKELQDSAESEADSTRPQANTEPQAGGKKHRRHRTRHSPGRSGGIQTSR